MSQPNFYTKTDEIAELQEELRLLKLDHEAIKGRIGTVEDKLTKIANRTPKSTKDKREEIKVTLEDCRLLSGRRVRILNPKNIEEITGTILKVGTLYVTIVLLNGKHLRRIAKNIRLIEDGDPR